jgi:hypothetical protein
MQPCLLSGKCHPSVMADAAPACNTAAVCLHEDLGPEIEALLCLQVLTTGFWPTYKQQDIDLPKEMLDSQAQFKVRCWWCPERPGPHP